MPTPFQTKAEEMKWLKDGCYQQWSPALGSLVIDEDRPPLQHAKLVEALQLVLPIILQPYMIHRFHATRPLAGNMTGVTTFQLDISNRTKGHNTVWECLEALTGLSALQIIGLQLRRDTLKQSPAATLVQQALAEYSYSGSSTAAIPATLTPVYEHACLRLATCRLPISSSLAHRSRRGGISTMHVGHCMFMHCAHCDPCSAIGPTCISNRMPANSWNIS